MSGLSRRLRRRRRLVFEVIAMKPLRMAALRKLALALMLPGLAGLVTSAMVSGHYLDTMPQWPSPQQSRTVPRNIHGIVVYQTAAEDRRLDILEYSSISVFLAGLTLGLVYLEKWGKRQAALAEDKEKLSRDFS